MRKVYLVIGASSDIGMEFIRCTAEKDPEAIFYAHYRTMNEALEKLHQNYLNQIQLIQADLAYPDEVADLINAVSETPTHILHLPASRIQYIRFRHINAEMLKKEMQIQVYSLLDILETFLPRMAKGKYGRVVAVATSCTIGIPPKFLGAYTIAKYALLGLIKSAAAEYAEKSICLNTLSPNMIETKFLSDIDERVIEMTAQGRPNGKNISLREVITAIEYLLSDHNPMCGENIVL